MDIFWIIISIFLGSLGQFFFKVASRGAVEKSALVDYYLSLSASYHLWLGVLCYGMSFLIWLRVLSRFDLSFARPLVGLGYIISALLALLFLGEKITLYRWIGILLIIAGVAFMSLSRNV